MKIEQLRVKNFKGLRSVTMRDIPNFCVIVGANGTGKSTIFHVFEFLQEALKSNVHTALVKEGGSKGFAEVRSRRISCIPRCWRNWPRNFGNLPDGAVRWLWTEGLFNGADPR